MVIFVCIGLFAIYEEMTVENDDYGQNDFEEPLNADLESTSDPLGLLSDENHAEQALQREEIKRLEEENRAYREREREALRRENEQLRAALETEREAVIVRATRDQLAQEAREMEEVLALPGTVEAIHIESLQEPIRLPEPGDLPTNCYFGPGSGLATGDPMGDEPPSGSRPTWCDNGNEKNETEWTICDTPRLWALENENRAIYDTVTSESYKAYETPHLGLLRSELNDFVNERDWCESNVACIEKAYRARILALNNIFN